MKWFENRTSPQFRFDMDNSVSTHTKWAPQVYQWMALKVRGFPTSSVVGGNSSVSDVLLMLIIVEGEEQSS